MNENEPDRVLLGSLTLRERECPSAESASILLETKYEIDADEAGGHLPLPKGQLGNSQHLSRSAPSRIHMVADCT